MSSIRSVCVYCGSSAGGNGLYLEAGTTLGRAIADAGLRLVYGGGTKGIMGAVAAGATERGGRITGIIPRFLIRKEAGEHAPQALDEFVVVENMHERKHRMFEESDAFVALPGGVGTLEEIVEIMTWAQLGRHRKPIVFANIAGFWNPMLALIDHMRAEGFVHTGHLVQPIVVDDAAGIVPALLAAGEPQPSEGDQAVIAKM